jgi:hypothetical protein
VMKSARDQMVHASRARLHRGFMVACTMHGKCGSRGRLWREHILAAHNRVGALITAPCQQRVRATLVVGGQRGEAGVLLEGHHCHLAGCPVRLGVCDHLHLARHLRRRQQQQQQQSSSSSGGSSSSSSSSQAAAAAAAAASSSSSGGSTSSSQAAAAAAAAASSGSSGGGGGGGGSGESSCDGCNSSCGHLWRKRRGRCNVAAAIAGF